MPEEGLAFPPCGTPELATVLRPRGEGGALSAKGTVEVVSSLNRDGSPVPGLPSLEESREQLRSALVSVPWEGLKLSRGEPAIPTTFLEPS